MTAERDARLLDAVLKGLILRRKAGDIYAVYADANRIRVKVGEWDDPRLVPTADAERVLRTGQSFADYFHRKFFPGRNGAKTR